MIDEIEPTHLETLSELRDSLLDVIGVSDDRVLLPSDYATLAAIGRLFQAHEVQDPFSRLIPDWEIQGCLRPGTPSGRSVRQFLSVLESARATLARLLAKQPTEDHRSRDYRALAAALQLRDQIDGSRLGSTEAQTCRRIADELLRRRAR